MASRIGAAVSGTELKVTSPAHDAGKVAVQVTTPAGTSPTGGGTDAFTYTAPTAGSPAWALGAGSSGQLGNGLTANSSTPVPVSGLTGVTAIAAGVRAGYALTH